MVKKDKFRRFHGFKAAVGQGFTLVELLVVLGIFSTVVVAASDIFILSNRSQRKIFGLERAQADARFAMEAMSREIRTAMIDYSYYAARGRALAIPDGELALIGGGGAKIRFAMSDPATAAACPSVESAPCLLLAQGGNPPVAVTPKGVAVRSARFYVSPAADPYAFNPATGGYASNDQPRVTIVLALKSVGERAAETSEIFLQTTVSGRGYKR